MKLVGRTCNSRRISYFSRNRIPKFSFSCWNWSSRWELNRKCHKMLWAFILIIFLAFSLILFQAFMLPNYTISANSQEQHVQIGSRKHLYTIHYTSHMQVKTFISTHRIHKTHWNKTLFASSWPTVHSWNVLTLRNSLIGRTEIA
jgi:hypothetical protein